VNTHVHLRPGGGFSPFDRSQLQEPIAAVFERQARRLPDAVAVKDGARQVTYAELNRQANQAAHALRGCHMDAAHPVVLLFSHNATMISAILGVLKAGGWYAPLDPAQPAARNAIILGEIGAALVLTDAVSLAAARSLGFTDAQTINLDELDAAEDCSDLGLPSAPDAPACVLYTSGSTGRPKGVLLDQQAVLHRAMVYTNDYFLGPDDRMALVQSYVFNASVREIYGALLNGAGLYFYSLRRDGVHHLAEWIEGEGITTLYLVPPTFRFFLDTLKYQKFESLRLVRLGGEAVLKRDVEGFQRHFGTGCILANGLAATETGTFLQLFMDHNTRIPGRQAPVGFAVQDKIVSLLDEDGCPVADGETGEIVVASAFMGPGYFSPPLSGAAPRSAPGAVRVVRTGDLGYRLADGCIMLVGRVDWQVKLRGQRINLLEIELALMSLEYVAEAAVTFQTAGDETSYLAAFIRARTTPDENALRQDLRALLPEAMVPAVFLFVGEFARTAGGKIDRRAFPLVTQRPGLGRSSATSDQPALTPVEQDLADMWRDLLKVDQVAPNDRFYDLGGDSLKDLALMARIEEKFNRRFPLSLLLQYQTLRELASAITTRDAPQPPDLLVSIQPLGSKPPIFFIPGIGGSVLAFHDLVVALGNERPLYGLQGADFGDSARNIKSVEEAAAEYVVAVRSVQPQGPYNLAGYSFGGHLALEIARQLAAPGEAAPPKVLLIDTYPPVPKRNTSLPNRARIHYDNLRQLKSAAEIASYFRDRLQAVYLRLIRHRSTRTLAQHLNAPDSSPAAVPHFALAAYKPEPYPGKVVLFKATQREWYVDWNPMDAWREFIRGELEIRTVPGGHNNLVKNPYAIELARQLNEALE